MLPLLFETWLKVEVSQAKIILTFSFSYNSMSVIVLEDKKITLDKVGSLSVNVQ